MGRIFAAIKRKLRAFIRRTLAELVQFLVSHPWLYKGPYNSLRHYFPSLYQWLISILRRFQIIGPSVKIIRVRGDQEQSLSPLGEKVLTDLEAIVKIHKEKQ